MDTQQPYNLDELRDRVALVADDVTRGVQNAQKQIEAASSLAITDLKVSADSSLAEIATVTADMHRVTADMRREIDALAKQAERDRGALEKATAALTAACDKIERDAAGRRELEAREPMRVRGEAVLSQLARETPQSSHVKSLLHAVQDVISGNPEAVEIGSSQLRAYAQNPECITEMELPAGLHDEFFYDFQTGQRKGEAAKAAPAGFAERR